MYIRTIRLGLVLAALAVTLLAVVSTALAATVSGQALSAKKLKSSTIFSIRTSSGSVVTGHAVSGTTFYKRGPNENGYHRVSRSEAYTVFTHWGGGGYCPAKLVYQSHRYGGKVRKLLSRVYFFLAGE
jgi:hypothetical protein